MGNNAQHFAEIIVPIHAAVVEKFVLDPARDADQLSLCGCGAAGRRDKIMPKLMELRGFFGFRNDDWRYAVMDGNRLLFFFFHLILSFKY